MLALQAAEASGGAPPAAAPAAASPRLALGTLEFDCVGPEPAPKPEPAPELVPEPVPVPVPEPEPEPEPELVLEPVPVPVPEPKFEVVKLTADVTQRAGEGEAAKPKPVMPKSFSSHATSVAAADLHSFSDPDLVSDGHHIPAHTPGSRRSKKSALNCCASPEHRPA